MHCSHLQSGMIVLPIIPLYPVIFPSLFFCLLVFPFFHPLHAPFVTPTPTHFVPIPPSFSGPSIRLPATPPANHFSWVGLIKGDLTECADHRNINQSLSNTVSPRWLPQPAANAHSSAKVNCIHYIRDRAKEGESENTVQSHPEGSGSGINSR